MSTTTDTTGVEALAIRVPSGPLAPWSLSETRRLMLLALALPAHSPEVRFVWMVWRRRQRELARQSYYRRRGLLAPPRTPLEPPRRQVPL